MMFLSPPPNLGAMYLPADPGPQQYQAPARSRFIALVKASSRLNLVRLVQRRRGVSALRYFDGLPSTLPPLAPFIDYGAAQIKRLARSLAPFYCRRRWLTGYALPSCMFANGPHIREAAYERVPRRFSA